MNTFLSFVLSKRKAALALVALLALIGSVAACAPIEGGADQPDTFNLHVNLVADGFELTWAPSSLGQAGGYEVQVSRSDIPNSSWMTVESPAVGTEPELKFSDVAENVRFMFRVRELVSTDDEIRWSNPVSAIFVKPVLPIVRIDTENHAPIVEKKLYLNMTASLEPNGTSHEAVTGSGVIRGRGSSTWIPEKKPYQIKFDSKTSLMGLPKAKKWVLLANYYDRSQLRTYTAALLSKKTDLEWTPTYNWVEVILNGSYVGLYQLVEKVEPGSAKIDIDELTEDDNEGESVTGGYFLQIDGRLEEGDELGWRISNSIAVVVEEPEPATTAQFDYIRSYVNAFDTALRSKNFTDPDEGYAKYLDVDSFIDYWLVQEATRNADVFWDSTYFYKRRSDPKLRFGPIWDHDLSMGNPATKIDTSPVGWGTLGTRTWPRRLSKDPAFMAKANARWLELLPQVSTAPAELLAVAPSLDGAKSNDRARWGGQYGPEAPEDSPQYLHDWLEDRITWLTDALADASAVDG